MLSKVHFESQTQKEVEFMSSLLISNSYHHEILIQAASSKDRFTLKKDQEDKWKVIEPNSVFYVPLSWFVKEKFIMIRTKEDQELFPNIKEHFAPHHPNYDHIKARTFELNNKLEVAMNVSYFKCKPTNLSVPGQFLVTFTPPICVCNYLFSDLLLLRKGHEEAEHVVPGAYFYITDAKIKEKKGVLASNDLVQWKFKDDDGTLLSSEFIPLFKQKEEEKKDLSPG
mmetsp:Transcript_26842/g.25890  ORF Transcript_26842/g.25890 Transcript_26842/m.25890 type:complete len:226 (-) Transcript_26842:67-744(-)